MIRGVGVIALAVVAVWVVAHVLYIGPVQDAAEVTLVWALGIAVTSLVVAALVLLAVAMTVGSNRPAWLRFVRAARNVAGVMGGALILVGLLHYRDTEPHGEIHWLALGLLMLVGAGIVHWWFVRAVRRQTV
jgi:hypothetical protein